MRIAAEPRPLTVALIGNPNTGKSTLFNALVGMRQRVGNYPGVTVEKKLGTLRHEGRRLTLIDLPGTYSLSPRSADENVAIDVLLGRRSETPRPDVVLSIVDASNLERNLYLVCQVLEIGVPVVVALNMTDIAERRGMRIDAELLAQRLGAPVVPIQAHRKRGLERLREALLAAAGGDAETQRRGDAETEHAEGTTPRLTPHPSRLSASRPQFPAAFCRETDRLAALLGQRRREPVPRFVAERLLLDVGGWLEHEARAEGDGLLDELHAARARLAEAGCRVPAVEARVRYGWIRELLAGVVARPAERPTTWSDRLDRFLTHRVWGTLVFVLLMAVVFQSIYAWAAPAMDLIDGGIGALGGLAASVLPEGALASLVTDGVIAGVGAVLVFLPQIAILFMFIAILEDCGYMARAAFLMDCLMSKIGLSGKSFIPLMSSFACAIPGVMATRVIENRRDRMVTILVAPLMSCSARLPVYVLLIGAFIPAVPLAGGVLGLQGLVLLVMHFVGVLVAVPIAWLLKKTFFRGETPPFVMELPSYKLPSLRGVGVRVYDRSKAFVVRAGTLIFATTIVVWALLYFPRPPEIARRYEAEMAAVEQALARESEPPAEPAAIVAPSPASGGGTAERSEGRGQGEGGASAIGEGEAPAEPRAAASLSSSADRDALLAALANRREAEYVEQSFMGRAGRFIEPAVEPLGWDWKLGMAALASFPAREVVVAALGTIYSLGGEDDPESDSLRAALRREPWAAQGHGIPVALSIMVFFALCSQCVSTLAVIKRETNSWFWPLFTFAYMTALAYLGALAVYQIAAWLI